MGIPGHAPCAPGPSTAPDCNPLFARAVVIRDAVSAALVVAGWSGDALVSHGKAAVNLPSCDQLDVWVAKIDRSPILKNHNFTTVVTYGVRLSIACFPAPQVLNGEAVIPSVTDQQDAAEWSYAWVTAMYDSLVALMPTCKTGSFDVAPITPEDPSGGCASWITMVKW